MSKDRRVLCSWLTGSVFTTIWFIQGHFLCCSKTSPICDLQECYLTHWVTSSNLRLSFCKWAGWNQETVEVVHGIRSVVHEGGQRLGEGKKNGTKRWGSRFSRIQWVYLFIWSQSFPLFYPASSTTATQKCCQFVKHQHRFCLHCHPYWIIPIFYISASVLQCLHPLVFCS